MGNLFVSENEARMNKLHKLKKKYSEEDCFKYRKGYPGLEDNFEQNSNKLFYANEISSKPEGDFIDEIHSVWWGDYRRLGTHHGYIQWLFPTRERGMNAHSQTLQLHEAEAIKQDPKCRERVLTSYKMMLDYYGIELIDSFTGEVKRAKNWNERINELNGALHNCLRITRIMKSLGELGYEHLKCPLVSFFITEIFVEKSCPNLKESLIDYWVNILRNEAERTLISSAIAILTQESIEK